MTKPVVITVGTGWDSSKGGLSTFNRFLSLPLARHVRVVCSLESFEERHAMDARERNVELLSSSIWQWKSSTGIATRLFDLPRFVKTLAVAKRPDRLPKM